MGLDFSHAKAHWSYSGFSRFREKLAKEIGIDLREMDGFKTDTGNPLGNYVQGKGWESIKDPIVYLLNHSDCDGHLTSRQCGLVAPRLKELVSEWPDDDYDKQQALELADGLEDCAANKTRMEFH